MKKSLIIVPVLLVILVTISLVTGNNKTKTNKVNNELTDALKFKEEYESLNGKTNDKGKEYVHIDVDEENPLVYANYDEIVDILENKSGVIYFGFPECPWCRNAVPVLIDAAKELGIDKIYYFNALSIRDTKKLDEDGNIVTEQEGTKEYYKLVELMSDVLPAYSGLNDDSIKRIYFPTVVFVKDGKLLGSHVSTLDSQEDPYKSLSNEQYNELKQIYIDGMNDVYEILCDEAC